MIEESYVSFEVAKLLKDKGFDEGCRLHYHYEEAFNKYFPTDESIYGFEQYYYPCPTLQMAMKWMEEVHNILVVADYVYECTDTSWVYKIYRLGENGKPEKVAIKGVSYDENNNPTEHIVGYRDYEISHKDYAAREDAEEEGIRYVLENLI